MTIYEEALRGSLTDEMIKVSKEERIDAKSLMKDISRGRAVIMNRPNCEPIGIGQSLRTKINVNMGTSSSIIKVDEEIEKIKIAEKYGADTISDLSMGGDIDAIRKIFVKNSKVPLTTVPIYQVMVETNDIKDVSEDLILKVIKKQINDGISSIVLHAAFSLENLDKMSGKRTMGIVSKGGSLTSLVMRQKSMENPFYKNFEYILEMIKDKDVVLNLGNAMRSGCIHDKIDEFQLGEIIVNAQLAKRANKKGIQVIIEGLGGHLNARDVIDWTMIHKKITGNRPLFVSGPLPIDIGVGHDHIAAAIGGAFASGHGADYLCAITPAEHLHLPTISDIKEGLIACKIAAHVGDSMKFGLNHLFDDDLNLSKNRFLKNWQGQLEHCLDPETFQNKHPLTEKDCSMCGKYCALSITKKVLR